MRSDLDRHIQAFLALDQIHGWGKSDFFKALGVRARRGIGSEATGLCTIPGMSRAVAEELMELGITEISELTERADIIATMGSDTLTSFLRRHGLGT